MIKAYIGGVAYKLAADYSISEQAANKIASDISVVLDDGQPIPKSGEIIEVRDDEAGEVYFLGVCGIPKSPKFSSPYSVKNYSITCSNANGILARRVVNVAYKGYTITQIVQALFDKYIAAEGFTLGGISEIPITLNIYTAADYGLQYCLDELAEYVSGAWYCTNDRRFYFTAKEDFEPFPRVVERGFIPITDLEVKVKDTDMRTSQIISGGKSETTEQREDFVFDGEDKNFTVSFSVSKKPVILVNAITVPPEKIGVKGLNDTDNSFMFLFAHDSAVISYNTLYNGASPPPLVVGDAVQIRYVGLFPIRAIVQNTDTIAEIAARTGTSGIIDNVKLDKSVRDIGDAVQLGGTLLQNYGATRTELKGWFTVREAKALGLTFEDFQLLRRWTFNLPEYGVVGDFVLTERTLTPFIKGGGIDNLKITLKLVDRAYLQSYGQVFEELSKAVSQLSIREDEIVVDVETSTEGREATEQIKTTTEPLDTMPTETVVATETISQTSGALDTSPDEIVETVETQRVDSYTDFMPLWCTSDTSGVLMCPSGLSLDMISEQHFSEVERCEDTIRAEESITQSTEPMDTDSSETLGLSENISTSEGELDTEQSERARVSESITQSEGAIDTENEERRAQTEQQLIEQFTGFMVLYCTSEAIFQTDGQIASPTGLSLFAFDSATGG